MTKQTKYVMWWYFAVMVVGGIISAKMVEVYRAPLPIDTLQQSSSASLRISIHLRHAANFDGSKVAQSVQSQLQQAPDPLGKRSRLSFQWQVTASPITASLEAVQKSPSAEEVDELLSSHSPSSKSGDFTLFILPSTSAVCGKGVTMGSRRHGWVCESEVSSIASTIASIFLNRPGAAEDGTSGLNPNLRLCMSLLNESPLDHPLHWQVPEAAETFLWPTLNRIQSIMRFSLDSQHVHFASLPVPVLGGSGSRYVMAESLNNFVNAKDWIVDPSTSTIPAFNLLLFVPSQENKGLSIVDKSGGRVACNCFAMAGFGGVVIQDATEATGENNTLLSLSRPLSLFAGQLLRDLGFRGSMRLPHRIAVGDWEIDVIAGHYIRRRVAAARHSLLSLQGLIHEISSMIVGDSITAPVMASLNALNVASTQWRLWKIEEASEAAKLAFTKAEEAFFHPSILSLLYFPDEHKLAVYIPFFVPVLLVFARPYLLLLKEWKANRQRARAAKSK